MMIAIVYVSLVINVIVLFLFGFQIIYKSLSAITVRDLRNPVVLSNLLIVVIHTISLGWLLKHGPL